MLHDVSIRATIAGHGLISDGHALASALRVQGFYGRRISTSRLRRGVHVYARAALTNAVQGKPHTQHGWHVLPDGTKLELVQQTCGDVSHTIPMPD